MTEAIPWKEGVKRAAIFFLLWVIVQVAVDLALQLLKQGKITVVNVLLLPMLPFPYSSLLATVITTVFVVRFWERRPLVSLGLPLDGRALLYLGGGAALGLVLERLLYSVHYWLTQGVWVMPWNAWPWDQTLDVFYRSLSSPHFVLPIVYEELYHRGYLLQILSVSVGAVPAVIGNALLWGMMHFYQGGILPVINVSLLGIALGIAYLRTRCLGLPLGVHLGINLANEIPFVSPSTDLPFSIWHGASSFTLFNGLLVLLFLLPVWKPHPAMERAWPRPAAGASGHASQSKS